MKREQARFLNLPFYQTGKVRKDPIGPADVAIVRELLEELQPELIFVAGDLSDPHGTHRMCKEAIDRRARGDTRGRAAGGLALSRRVAGVGRSPRPTWLVPLSQEELRLKIQAIFKHQTQKDSAPFPGQDDREFWQRVEARNKDTAARSTGSGSPSTSRWKRTSSAAPVCRSNRKWWRLARSPKRRLPALASRLQRRGADFTPDNW